MIFIQACSKSPEELGFESQEDLDLATQMGFDTFSSYSAQGKFSSPERALKALRMGFVDSDQLDKHYYDLASERDNTNSELLSIVANIENYYKSMALHEHIQLMLTSITENTKKKLKDKNLAVNNQEYLGFDYDSCLKFNSFLAELNDKSFNDTYKTTLESYCNKKRISEYIVLKEKADQAKIQAENKAYNDKIMAEILESQLEQAEQDADQYNKFFKCQVAAAYSNYSDYSSFFTYNKSVISLQYDKKDPKVNINFKENIGISNRRDDPWVKYGETQNYFIESCIPIAASICNAAKLGASTLGTSKISVTQRSNLQYCSKFN